MSKTSTTISPTRQQTPNTPPLATFASATAAGQRDLETRNQVLIDFASRPPVISSSSSPSTSSPPPRYTTSSTPPMREANSNMSKGKYHHDEHDRSPSTLRNSMSLQRPSFYHTNTEYHTHHQSSSSSSLGNGNGNNGGSSGVGIGSGNGDRINTQSLMSAHSQSHSQITQPYRDHPPTKEEYPHSSSNQYTQSFPPRSPGSGSRRIARNSNAGPLPAGSVSVWDATRCRLWDFKCRLCSKEGAIGRGLMIGWVLTTVGFLMACGFWKGELFTGES